MREKRREATVGRRMARTTSRNEKFGRKMMSGMGIQTAIMGPCLIPKWNKKHTM